MTEESVSNTTEAVVPDSEKTKIETVSYETHAKLLKQRKADQDKTRELEQQLSQFEAEKKAAEDADLERKGEYQKINEGLRKQLADEKTQREDLDNMVKNAFKMNAFKAKLPGKMKHADYEDYVMDKILKDVIIDPDTRQIDENSLSEKVEWFMEGIGKDMVDIPVNTKTMPTRPTTTTKTTGNIPNDDIKASILKGLGG